MVNSGPAPPLNTSLPFFPKSSDYPPGYLDAWSPYKYVPTTWVCILFLVLFGFSTLIHFVQSIRSKLYWLIISACFCGILETVGWGGRLWGSHDPIARNPYIVQFCLIIVAPTALVAANFMILGRIVQRLGPQYSRLRPRLLHPLKSTDARIFVTADIVCLLIQAMGGAIASGGNSHVQLGSHIALIGIIIQLMSIALYVALAIEFLARYSKDRPIRHDAELSQRGFADERVRRMIQAISFMTVVIIIRSIYRLLELSEGQNGSISSSQITFDILDAVMITLAIYTLNIFHPGRLLRGQDVLVPEVPLKGIGAGGQQGAP
ncbi:RTA1 like protein-domain-containing protein [Gloeopeniophorella convolvens]|nr:RTA1 like protein-domain-containing protein [Gloeopeniophorella convolvens]